PRRRPHRDGADREGPWPHLPAGGLRPLLGGGPFDLRRADVPGPPQRPLRRRRLSSHAMAAAGTPVVFVHGLWLHADSWAPWAERFRDAGYVPASPGWPGDVATVEETRRQPQLVAGYGINAIVEHYAKAIDGLSTKPIVIGHSFGGLIAQRLLAEGRAAAAVGIDAAPIKGVLFLPPSALRVASVALRNPLNRKRAVSLSRDQFRYGFGNAVSAQESDELYERWTIPSPG